MCPGIQPEFETKDEPVSSTSNIRVTISAEDKEIGNRVFSSSDRERCTSWIIQTGGWRVPNLTWATVVTNVGFDQQKDSSTEKIEITFELTEDEVTPETKPEESEDEADTADSST